ncbi:MAG TPA: tRNA (adenosine(37)-N6)-dimethylallyltransferase MiaA [Chthoniobacteraceae bacterium]|jgi:tRNA dimethylallyltransferase|nr:tRNA (adenosine(37)-N6)-dimethylallyltransferase MiaA [Chthoniobacteraceae bacterium]
MMYFITGPTSCGKSGIAAEIAQRFNAEIIGADAFQVYAGLECLTAWPEAELRARAPHHLIGTIPPAEKFDVAQYRELALAKAKEIESRGKRVLVAGGTGLYIRALTNGLSDLPPEDADIRRSLDSLTLGQLQERYALLDPRGMEKIDVQNRRRLVRAIEVSLLAGVPFSTLRADWSGITPPASPPLRGVALERDREDLYARIDARVRQMFAQGVVEEVRAAAAGPTASQAIGYADIQALLRGEITLETCIATIQQRTRRYAKRQLTWLRRENRFPKLNLTNQPHRGAVNLIARLLEADGPEVGVSRDV